MKTPITLLYLDPEPNNLHAFSAWFRRKAAYESHTSRTAAEALAILQDFPVHVLLVDQPTPESIGIEFLTQVPAASQPPVKIVLSAHRDLSLLEQAVKEGMITSYFTKPINFKELNKLLVVSC